MKFLLLTYDPQDPDGPDVIPFDDEASAFAELKHATHAKQPREEVVLFHTDSIETLQQPHSRYFYSASEIVARMCKTVEQLRDDIRASGTISAGL